MDLTTYDEATRLLERYRLCEKVMAYLTDTTTAKGQTYTDTLKSFFTEYRDELLVFVNSAMNEAGMAFEDLHCCAESEDTTEENPDEQDNTEE